MRPVHPQPFDGAVGTADLAFRFAPPFGVNRSRSHGDVDRFQELAEKLTADREVPMS
jgi:hypothetical protein